MRFYAYLPSDCHLSTTEVEAFVAILGPHVDNVDKVFVKTGTHKDADAIRVGFFLTLFRPVRISYLPITYYVVTRSISTSSDHLAWSLWP